MNVILINQARLTLTPNQEANPEFQRGLKLAKETPSGQSPAGAASFTDATWIGFFTGKGKDCARTAAEVRISLGS